MAMHDRLSAHRRFWLAPVALCVGLLVSARPAVAEPIPITVEQGRAQILIKVRAIDERHHDITGHTVGNCHSNVIRQIVTCQVGFTRIGGEVCRGHAEVSKIRSGGHASYVYRQYGLSCQR